MTMKLHFDANQDYQLEAIQSVVDLFDGQPLNAGEMAFSLLDEAGSMQLNEIGLGNQLALDDRQLLENLNKVQARNQVPASGELDGLHFSVEMETGTGKTYVYLRTIYKLHQMYGFSKFVIVVPSVAIREGVLKNLEITQEHFATLFSRQPAKFEVYDSKRVSQLRSFASSNTIQILVLNIDSFAKDENIINRPNDKLSGKNPIEFIQATRPIVIVDEPQRMETDIRRQAIANLNPLCTLRYSATHLNLYNLVYSLNPVEAYDLGLVKQIEVDSVVEEDSFNQAYVRLEGFRTARQSVSARITIDVNAANGVERKTVTAKPGDDLYELSNQREVYQNGFVVNAIDAGDGSIDLSNGERKYVGQSDDALQDEIMKLQLRRMVDEHFKKERRYKQDGIKVLSLIFIDRVANYRGYDENGNPNPGKFAHWFEEIFEEFAAMPANEGVIPFEAHEIHNGYFAQDNKGHFKDSKTGKAKADVDTYQLIMKEKEKLLDIDVPLRFIFSHSALREGWDNPNVFQICTLNETRSEMRKRQEIGRGLRLAVNQQGQRVFDRSINRLTVFANESYDDFARQLQSQIEEETGVQFAERIKNVRERRTVKLRKAYALDKNFLELWERIKHRTTYKVQYESAKLVADAAAKIEAMPPIRKPRLRAERRAVAIREVGVETEYRAGQVVEVEGAINPVPDILGYIQGHTKLTRKTILDILKESGRLGDVLINPQLFLDQVVERISTVLQELMVAGIKYQVINGQSYDMMLFEAREISSYLSRMHEVKNQEKTLGDYIVWDSQVEKQFAIDCDNSEQVEFFIKLPNWFKIPTPIGTYNPDWALILKNDQKLYFVAETKFDPDDEQNLRPDEKMKIACGTAHFAEFEGVDYKAVQKVSDLL